MNRRKPDDPLCQTLAIHGDLLEIARPFIPGGRDLRAATDLFKALSDPARVRIIRALTRTELCVCDLAALLEMSQPAISHHLKTLRQLKMIRFRREGKCVYYRAGDPAIGQIVGRALTMTMNEEKS